MAQFNQDVCHAINTLNLTLEMAKAKHLFWPEADKIYITSFIPVVVAIGILANALFLFTIAQVRRMRTEANFYLGTLAVLDIFFLAFGIGFHFMVYFYSPLLQYNYPFESSMGCWLIWICNYFGVFASIALITLVSLERYFAICYPLHHGMYKGRARTAKWICGACLLALVVAVAGTLWRGHLDILCIRWANLPESHESISIYRRCLPLTPNADIFSLNLFSVVYFTCLVINIVAYVKIIVALNTRHVSVDGSQHQKVKNRQHDVRNQVARLLIINGTVYFLCYMPNRAASLFYILNRYGINVISFHRYQIFVLFSRGLVIMNSSLNPFIYAFSSQFYRQAFIEAIRALMCIVIPDTPMLNKRQRRNHGCKIFHTYYYSKSDQPLETTRLSDNCNCHTHFIIMSSFNLKSRVRKL